MQDHSISKIIYVFIKRMVDLYSAYCGNMKLKTGNTNY